MLTPDQEQQFRDHLRAVNARETCPTCDAGRWTIEANSQIGLLERSCACCGYVMLFDPKSLGWHILNQLVSIEPGRYEAQSTVAPLAAPQRIAVEDIQSGTIRSISWPGVPPKWSGAGKFSDHLTIQDLRCSGSLSTDSAPPNPISSEEAAAWWRSRHLPEQCLICYRPSRLIQVNEYADGVLRTVALHRACLDCRTRIIVNLESSPTQPY